MRGDGESAERLEGEGGAGQRVGKYFVRVVGMESSVQREGQAHSPTKSGCDSADLEGLGRREGV